MVQEAKSRSLAGQLPSQTRNWPLHAFLTALLALTFASHANAARFIAYFPLPANTPRQEIGEIPSSDSRESFAASQMAIGNLSLPVAHSRVSESLARDWKAYCDVWRKHFEQPDDAITRDRLGLSSPSIQITQSSGRSTAASMRLPVADLQRFESEHFMLLTDVPAKRANEVIIDLEKFYSVWTQLFFPLWRDRTQWDRT
jgi:hypothetical protein